MSTNFKTFTGNLVGSPATHPISDQVGAFCYQHTPDGLKFLLVTSSRGRWILPKGWPMKKHTSAEVALAEAWEEAGVADGVVSRDPALSYDSMKHTKKRGTIFTRVAVHTIAVTRLEDVFPEADDRARRWATLAEAERRVSEENLLTAIRALASQVSIKA
ncbi:MAG: NUDIX hydrolase [Pseudomonadota bacterium]